MKTAGAFHYCTELAEISQAHGTIVMVELTIEGAGPYAGAVQVLVAGHLVGHVSHEQAPAYREIIEQLGHEGKPATCRAELELDQYCNVWLSAKPKPRGRNEPFLPELGVGVYVELNPEGSRMIDEILAASEAKNKRFKRVVDLQTNDTTWCVLLHDTPIGIFPCDTYQYLEEARDAGLPTTARLSIVKEQGRPLRVGVQFP